MLEEMSPICSYSVRVSWDRIDLSQLAEIERWDVGAVEAAAVVAEVARSIVVSMEAFFALPFFLASLGAMAG